MSFARQNAMTLRSDSAMLRISRGAPTCFCSGRVTPDNGAPVQVMQGSPAFFARGTNPLRHTHSLERYLNGIFARDGVYSRAESVHRFERLSGFVREARCRKATTKPTYGQGCRTAAVLCKPSLFCGPRIWVPGRWMRSMYATSARRGGVDTESSRYSDTRATRYTWVLASVGSSGCSVMSLITAGRSFFTAPGANTCSASPACAPLTMGVLPKRKVGRPAPHRTSHRGNGRCASLRYQQGTPTRSRLTFVGRAVA